MSAKELIAKDLACEMLDASDELVCMVQFLNFAYNNAPEHRPMNDSEKTGGQAFFFLLEERVKALQGGIAFIAESF